jgi:large subunit ribosomal protein L2
LAIVLKYNFFKNKVFLGLIKYVNGSLALVKLAHGLAIGSYIKSIMYSIKVCKQFLLGCRVLLSILKKNMIIFDISLVSGCPSVARSSGTYSQVLNLNFELGLALIKLPSLSKKYVSMASLVTLGRNSNIYQKYTVQGYAGLNYRIGRKPIVRGVAMNPVDHPHGGRTKTNKPEVSP